MSSALFTTLDFSQKTLIAWYAYHYWIFRSFCLGVVILLILHSYTKDIIDAKSTWYDYEPTNTSRKDHKNSITLLTDTFSHRDDDQHTAEIIASLSRKNHGLSTTIETKNLYGARQDWYGTPRLYRIDFYDLRIYFGERENKLIWLRQRDQKA